VFTKYGPQARAVLDALLEKYRDEGVLNLDDANVLKVTPFRSIRSSVCLL
jgi:type I restriction enzyme R subunit